MRTSKKLNDNSFVKKLLYLDKKTIVWYMALLDIQGIRNDGHYAIVLCTLSNSLLIATVMATFVRGDIFWTVAGNFVFGVGLYMVRERCHKLNEIGGSVKFTDKLLMALSAVFHFAIQFGFALAMLS